MPPSGSCGAAKTFPLNVCSAPIELRRRDVLYHRKVTVGGAEVPARGCVKSEAWSEGT